MVTAGGLNSLPDSWVPSVYYERDKLLESWPKAVIKLLRTALRIGQLVSSLTVDEMETLLDEQEKRWWSVNIQSFNSKEHFLRYAGRYARRPPIAQKRVTEVGEGIVRFWYRDKKLRRKVYVQVPFSPYWNRSRGHVPNLDGGQNPSSETSDGIHYWTRKATE